MITSDFVSRLHRVKRTRNDSWIACCPAHEDRSPSMTIRELPDGRTLIHCFSGCTVEQIVTAVGLELSDLFPDEPKFDDSIKPVVQKFNPFDVMEAVSFEVKIVALAAFDMAKGVILNDIDRSRLLLAATRLNEAEEMIHGKS